VERQRPRLHRLAEHLRNHPGRALCAACLGTAVELPRSQVANLCPFLEVLPGMVRRHDRCSGCGRQRLVILSLEPPATAV
jgi:hypothetical protein